MTDNPARIIPDGGGNMPRRLLVMDVDSTLTRTEGIDLLADIAGVGDQVSAITDRAMHGELDFAASLRERVALLKGLDEAAVAEACGRVVVTQGAKELCAELHGRGWTIGVVSGGFVPMVQPLAARFQLEHWRANTLEVVDGTLTGRVLGDIVTREGKAAALKEWASIDGVAMRNTVAMGDGANDIDMVCAAGTGVAFRAKPSLVAVADVSIPSGPLTELLAYI